MEQALAFSCLLFEKTVHKAHSKPLIVHISMMGHSAVHSCTIGLYRLRTLR